MTPAESSAPESLPNDVRTITLIGLAHGTSHFFHLMLPPLFPVFIRDFGLSYAELGLLVSTFFLISGLGQAMAGFLVDRVGARPVLFAALSCFVLGAVATATAQGYSGLILAAALAGLGNAPFHPVDFTILNARVSPARLGHAYSVHGITGNLGWAAAPVFLTGLGAALGSWRLAALAMALWALLVMGVLWLGRRLLDDCAARAAVGEGAGARPNAEALAPAEHPLAFLRLPSVWICFSFFFFTTCALSAIQSFASPALAALYGLREAATAFVVSGYMLFGAAGMVVGGFMAARAERLERIIAWSLMGSAGVLVLVGTGVFPSGAVAAIVVAAAGLGTGLAGPSRDMLIKRAAPPGATGRVYGTVYSGLDLGFALAAPIFGALLDRHLPSEVFYGTALALALGVSSATLVGRGLARQRAGAVS